MRWTRLFGVVAIAVVTGVGIAACGGDDGDGGGGSEEPSGTYTGTTRQGLRVTLTVSGSAVRRAGVRLRGRGAVVQRSDPCAIRATFGERGVARIGDDGRFAFRPLREDSTKGHVRKRTFFALQGRFSDAGRAAGTLRHRIQSTIKVPAKQIEVGGSQVRTPAQTTRIRCEGGRLRFAATRRR